MSLSTIPTLTLLVFDDHPVFLDVLAQALAADPDVKIAAMACDATVAAWRRHRPAVTLIDLRVLGVDGLRTLRQIRSLDAAARVLVFTSADQRHDMAAALEAGAAGCITKAMRYEDLLAAIRKVHAKGWIVAPAAAAAHPDGEAERELTSREPEILLLLREGLSQEQISRRLAIADRTVRVHILALKENSTPRARCSARREPTSSASCGRKASRHAFSLARATGL